MLSRTRRWLATAIAIPAVVAVPAAGALVPAVAADSPAQALLAEMADPSPLAPIEPHDPGAGDRYDLAMGCFSLYSPGAGAHVARQLDYGLDADAATAEPLLFRPFDLGKYLLFSPDERFLAAQGGPVEAADANASPTVDRLPVRPGSETTRAIQDDLPSVVVPDPGLPSTRTGGVTSSSAPSALAEWIVRDHPDGGFTLHLPVDDRDAAEPGPSDVAGDAPVAATLVAGEDGALAVEDGDLTTDAARFEAQPADGCASFPEVDVNVAGDAPPAGNPVDETRGYVDGHLHMMAFEFIGGRSRCGRPWHPYGVAYALVDCPDHEPGGHGAFLEFLLSGEPTHDTTGWPDFPYWPKYDSLTHEQVYYRWMERAWRGGLRMFTNLLVDNNSLCEAWVYKGNSCNEMDGVRLQAQRLRELERYVDAEWGGPGEGWFRIVTDPFEARRTMNEGRLAVVMGIEVSVLFDCGIVMGQPQCSADDIDRELAEVHELGVRQMEFVNKFDNALSGVTGDNGQTGMVVNLGNFADTGQFWQMRTCDEPEGHDDHSHDKHQTNVNDHSGLPTGPFLERDGIFGAVLQTTGTSGVAPLYPEGPHCNVRGLADLGRHLLGRMVERGMLFDPDHMSALGREQALDHLQALDYSGVISSHSWADDLVYERVLAMGGLVTPYAGDAAGFVQKWRDTRSWADPRFYFGIGYGADTNGFGSQGAPRNPAEGEPAVTYPFTGLGGTSVDRQVSGNQVYDINTDGVDHYGLYPDWIEDIRVQLGAEEGALFLDEMQRGPEAYLQMWERALGIGNDGCRDPLATRPTGAQIRELAPGTRYEEVLTTLGQPHERSGGEFRYCTADGVGTVTFDEVGEVLRTRADTRSGTADEATAATATTTTVDELHPVSTVPHTHPELPVAASYARPAAASSPANGLRGPLSVLGLAGVAAALLRRPRRTS